jgi:hypothetical protein
MDSLRRRAADNKSFLSKYSAILTAIALTFTVIGALYASVIKPNLEDEIQSQVAICHEKYKSSIDLQLDRIKKESVERQKRLINRLLKIECNLYIKMTKEEREQASDLFKQLGGE